MTDGTSAETHAPIDPVDAPGLPPIPLERPPRPGDLTIVWRLVTAAVWIGVAAALAAVWNASVQIGLATWWLGPRSSPQPVVVKLLPFVPSVLMLLATINQVRRLAILGLVASAAVALVGLVDLGYVRGLALVELGIAAAAGLASAASLTGTYRRGDDRAGEPAPTDVAGVVDGTDA